MTGDNVTQTDLAAWTPIRVALESGGPVVEWCHTEGVDFDDPFFDQTVERCLRHPFRLLFRRTTSMASLVEWTDRHPAPAPSGFVFHGSRCGSTLIMQMLAATGSTVCISEPGPVDTILRGARSLPEVSTQDRVAWLRAVVAALVQPRRPGQRHAVVKLDAWSVFELPLVRAAFPEVPWIFVYRDPAAVLVSQLRRRGYHMIPGALAEADVGLEPGAAMQLSPEEFAAAVLGRIYAAGLDGHVPGRSLLVHHGELPGAVTASIAPLFGIDVDDDLEAVAAAAGRDAKNPALAYEDDRASKERRATPAVHEAARRWASAAYRDLESARACG